MQVHSLVCTQHATLTSTYTSKVDSGCFPLKWTSQIIDLYLEFSDPQRSTGGWLTELWSLVPTLTMNKCSRKQKHKQSFQWSHTTYKGNCWASLLHTRLVTAPTEEAVKAQQASCFLPSEGGRTLLHHLCALTSRHCGISLDCAYVLSLSSWGSSLLTWRQSGMGIQVLKHNSILHILFLPVVKMFHIILESFLSSAV